MTWTCAIRANTLDLMHKNNYYRKRRLKRGESGIYIAICKRPWVERVQLVQTRSARCTIIIQIDHEERIIEKEKRSQKKNIGFRVLLRSWEEHDKPCLIPIAHKQKNIKTTKKIVSKCCDTTVKSLLLINKPNQVKRKKIDSIEELVPLDHPRAMIWT